MELLLKAETTNGYVYDLVVVVHPEHTVASLAAEIGTFVEKNPWETFSTDHDRRPVSPDELVSRIGLLSGVTVKGAKPENMTNLTPDSGGYSVELWVTSGPHEGLITPLENGEYVVARFPDQRSEGMHRILLSADRAVSRGAHLILTVTSVGVTVREEDGVTNAATINQTPISTTGLNLKVGDRIELGDSELELVRRAASREQSKEQLGQTPFHRTPFRPARPKEVELKPIGGIPVSPEPTRFSLLTIVLVPVISGLVMILLMRDWRFLAFVAMGPLLAGGNLLEQKKTSGKKFQDAVGRFTAKLDDRQQEIDRLVAAEETIRTKGAPNLADLADRAQNRRPALWHRGRNIDEFLSLRVGVATQRSQIVVASESQGDASYLDQVAEVVERAENVTGTPLLIALAEHGTISVHGPSHDNVARMARSLVVQASCLHSPEDLVICVASSNQLALTDWTKWLPHTRHTGSPLRGRHVVGETPSQVRQLLLDVREVVMFRLANADTGVDRRWPWVLLVLDKLVEPDPTLVADIMQNAQAAGVSVIWASDDESRIPPESKLIISLENTNGISPEVTGDKTLTALLWSTDPDIEQIAFIPDGLASHIPVTVGSALAPLRDASSASQTSAIPKLVPLYEPFSIDRASPRWIAEQWNRDRGYVLQAVIGRTATSPLTIDLIEDGPHALIGGTSGSGKSELIQSLIAGLLVSHSPADLNLLFIDFKGGSATEVFRDLPHVVGSVSDLDESLARRAKIAIRAELRRRVHLFNRHKAKDMAEMRFRALNSEIPKDQQIPRKELPGSLVIVVDEFATLKAELPEFMAEIVDIAQRGRSYGIHLLLATQRPSSSIDENIAANANLRIALRMLEASESGSVIDAPDAATIPVPLKGRAFARLGPGDLVEFQSSFSGAPLADNEGLPPIELKKFDPNIEESDNQAEKPKSDKFRTTQLEDLVTAIQNTPWTGQPPQPVWSPPLPERLPNQPLRSANTNRIAGRQILVGKVDRPAERVQEPLTLDLNQTGGLVLVGVNGAGKTTALRTIATNAALDATEQSQKLTIFTLDFSSGELASKARLSGWQAGTTDDLETTTRIVDYLRLLIAHRRQNPTTNKAQTPTVLLLIDDFANLRAALEATNDNPSDRGDWNQTLAQIIAEGRQFGIYTVVTTQRYASLPSHLRASITSRIALKLADESEAFDLATPPTEALHPGAGYMTQDLIQISDTTDADTNTLTNFQNHITIPELPDSVPYRKPQNATLKTCEIGIADITQTPVALNMQTADLMVVGPPESGRSNLLGILGRNLQAQDIPVYAIGGPHSPLKEGQWTDSAFTADQTRKVLADIRTGRSNHQILLIDDLDIVMAEDDIWSLECDGLGPEKQNLRIAASLSAVPIFAQNPIYRRFQINTQLIYLTPSSSREVADAIGQMNTAPLRLGLHMPPGRGVLATRTTTTTFQTYHGDPQ